MKKIHTSLRAFSIIEVMVGIFIFSLWLVAIYSLLASSLNANEYSKNAIIASNLSREQLELFKNIRDTNYKKLNVWNQINPNIQYSVSNLFNTWSYYTIENDFLPASSFSIKTSLILSFKEGKESLNDMENYRLCTTSDNIYTYDCSSSWNIETPFYRYLYIEDATDEFGNIVPEAYKITSKVIWYKRGYHEFNIKTIVTDWRRI